MGNKCLVKPDNRTGIPSEAFIRLLHYAGLPKNDLDLMYADGPVTEEFLRTTTENGSLRMTLFTGSQSIADKLIKVTHGRIKLEDAGFDWKVLGPDGAAYTDHEVK